MSQENTILSILLLTVIVVLVFIIFGPYITIWSLNTVFGLQIPFTFKTWVAVNWILLVLHGITLKFKKSSDT